MKITKTILVQQPGLAAELLAEQVPTLSKGRIKDAMNKGAVLWQRGKQQKRLRRAQSKIAAGEQLHLHYDDDILQRQCEPAVCIADQQHYSIWYKPPGMLSQGNEWGDHLSLLRFAELYFDNKRQVFLVHRLDREASGLVILAHQSKTAALFSQLIQQHRISKDYQVLVPGQLPPEVLLAGKVTLPLDGKACETRFRLAQYQPQAEHSFVRYCIDQWSQTSNPPPFRRSGSSGDGRSALWRTQSRPSWPWFTSGGVIFSITRSVAAPAV